MSKASTADAATHTSDSEILVRDGRIGRYGFIFLDDIDSDEFRELKGAAVRVYLTLLPFAAKGSGECYPKQTTLGRITGLRRDTVNKAIGQLESVGLLKRSVMANPRGGIELTVYTILRPPSRRPESRH